jgi:hypothetical protein
MLFVKVSLAKCDMHWMSIVGYEHLGVWCEVDLAQRASTGGDGSVTGWALSTSLVM